MSFSGDRNPAGEAPAAAAAAETAESAGLAYVRANAPGIVRVRHGRGFRYVGPGGNTVRDAKTLARIRALVIPPAWTRVWICADPHGHLQATGRDAKGRKQYRYHTHWRGVRDANKYERLAAFVRKLPRIRRRVRKDLALAGLPREKVFAAVVRLLETTFIRVGNERYARENGSFGLTTLRNRHVSVRGPRIQFEFRGKSGKRHTLELSDARLARIIRRCRELPGYELFQYVENDEVRSVDSADINAYLKETTGDDYTAKDFRTWGGTMLAGLAFARQAASENEKQSVRVVAQVIREVAAELGNTAAICRSCYVHPRVIEAYCAGDLGAGVPLGCKGVLGLRSDEARILRLLERPLRVTRNVRRPVGQHAARLPVRVKNSAAMSRRARPS